MPVLGRNLCLAVTARLWSQNMDNRNSMYHSDLANWHSYFCGWNWRALGENIGTMGCSNTQTAAYCSQILYKAFAASPHHRDNMLGGKDAAGNPLYFNYWGVGAVRDTT